MAEMAKRAAGYLIVFAVVSGLLLLGAPAFLAQAYPPRAKQEGVEGVGLQRGPKFGRRIEGRKDRHELRGKPRSEGWHEGLSDEEKQELMRLKSDDPEKFKEAIGARRKALIEDFRRLKEADPDKYLELKEQYHSQRVERLRSLKKEDPEAFKKMMERRRQNIQQRLEFLREKDPEKYQQIIEQHKMLELDE